MGTVVTLSGYRAIKNWQTKNHEQTAQKSGLGEHIMRLKKAVIDKISSWKNIATKICNTKIRDKKKREAKNHLDEHTQTKKCRTKIVVDPVLGFLQFTES